MEFRRRDGPEMLGFSRVHVRIHVCWRLLDPAHEARRAAWDRRAARSVLGGEGDRARPKAVRGDRRSTGE